MTVPLMMRSFEAQTPPPRVRQDRVAAAMAAAAGAWGNHCQEPISARLLQQHTEHQEWTLQKQRACREMEEQVAEQNRLLEEERRQVEQDRLQVAKERRKLQAERLQLQEERWRLAAPSDVGSLPAASEQRGRSVRSEEGATLELHQLRGWHQHPYALRNPLSGRTAAAPPPRTQHGWSPDPRSVFAGGCRQGVFFPGAPPPARSTSPDRSCSLDRLTKGLPVGGSRASTPRASMERSVSGRSSLKTSSSITSLSKYRSTSPNGARQFKKTY